MEAFERRNLVRWQGAEGAAVQAPSTFRDADQRARDPAETIAVAYFLRLGPTVLSAPASLNPCHQTAPIQAGKALYRLRRPDTNKFRTTGSRAPAQLQERIESSAAVTPLSEKV